MELLAKSIHFKDLLSLILRHNRHLLDFFTVTAAFRQPPVLLFAERIKDIADSVA